MLIHHAFHMAASAGIAWLLWSQLNAGKFNDHLQTAITILFLEMNLVALIEAGFPELIGSLFAWFGMYNSPGAQVLAVCRAYEASTRVGWLAWLPLSAVVAFDSSM